MSAAAIPHCPKQQRGTTFTTNIRWLKLKATHMAWGADLLSKEHCYAAIILQDYAYKDTACHQGLLLSTSLKEKCTRLRPAQSTEAAGNWGAAADAALGNHVCFFLDSHLFFVFLFMLAHPFTPSLLAFKAEMLSLPPFRIQFFNANAFVASDKKICRLLL